jgi:anti-sigma regulatory factor (Ser/Thr protein kinase)
MALTGAVRLRIEDASGVAPARRAAESFALRLGFDEPSRGRAAIVVTELGTNLVRHAQRGEIVLRPASDDEPTLDIIAWDHGPGIADPMRARADGYSTSGGLGTGLGAIERLSAAFELQTAPGQGTVVAVRLGAHGFPEQIDGLVLPIEGEEISGDAWASVRDGEIATLMLADGLGHGAEAARAAAAATRQLRPSMDPVEMLERTHDALRSTRGAAAAVARLNLATGSLRFAGVGNIAATIVTDRGSMSLASTNGTVGHRVPKIRADDVQLDPGALLILHSDGCKGGWNLLDYPGLRRRAPLVAASVLVRDFERGRDDVSVVVARVRSEPG